MATGMKENGRLVFGRAKEQIFSVTVMNMLVFMLKGSLVARGSTNGLTETLI